jgi:hypothetical protein
MPKIRADMVMQLGLEWVAVASLKWWCHCGERKCFCLLSNYLYKVTISALACMHEWKFATLPAMRHVPSQAQIHHRALIMWDVPMTPVHIMTPSTRFLVMHDSMLQTCKTVAGYKWCSWPRIALFTFQTFAWGIILKQHITSLIPLVCFDIPKLRPSRSSEF